MNFEAFWNLSVMNRGDVTAIPEVGPGTLPLMAPPSPLSTEYPLHGQGQVPTVRLTEWC